MIRAALSSLMMIAGVFLAYGTAVFDPGAVAFLSSEASKAGYSLSACASWFAEPFVLYYGAGAWLWALFLIGAGPALLKGMSPRVFLIRFFSAHAAAFLFGLASILFTGALSYRAGGVAGVLTARALSAVMPSVFWAPFACAFLFLALAGVSSLPADLIYRIHKWMQGPRPLPEQAPLRDYEEEQPLPEESPQNLLPQHFEARAAARLTRPEVPSFLRDTYVDLPPKDFDYTPPPNPFYQKVEDNLIELDDAPQNRASFQYIDAPEVFDETDGETVFRIPAVEKGSDGLPLMQGLLKPSQLVRLSLDTSPEPEPEEPIDPYHARRMNPLTLERDGEVLLEAPAPETPPAQHLKVFSLDKSGASEEPVLLSESSALYEENPALGQEPAEAQEVIITGERGGVDPDDLILPEDPEETARIFAADVPSEPSAQETHEDSSLDPDETSLVHRVELLHKDSAKQNEEFREKLRLRYEALSKSYRAEPAYQAYRPEDIEDYLDEEMALLKPKQPARAEDDAPFFIETPLEQQPLSEEAPLLFEEEPAPDEASFSGIPEAEALPDTFPPIDYQNPESFTLLTEEPPFAPEQSSFTESPELSQEDVDTLVILNDRINLDLLLENAAVPVYRDDEVPFSEIRSALPDTLEEEPLSPFAPDPVFEEAPLEELPLSSSWANPEQAPEPPFAEALPSFSFAEPSPEPSARDYFYEAPAQNYFYEKPEPSDETVSDAFFYSLEQSAARDAETFVLPSEPPARVPEFGLRAAAADFFALPPPLPALSLDEPLSRPLPSLPVEDESLAPPEAALMPRFMREEASKNPSSFVHLPSKAPIFPSADVLVPNTDNIDPRHEDEEIEKMVQTIEQAFASFNITMKVVDYSRGPAITRFELEPPSGLKLRTIRNLQDDIALQLGISNIRIISPVEGRSYIGIEVPNTIRRSFMLREFIEDLSFTQSPAGLPLILGTDVGGTKVSSDLTSLPHLLVAGTTGSGKSVYINALIGGLLFKLSSDELKFIMIDPKMVELELYNGIPHLLAPIITKPEEAMAALEWAVQEMDRRYRLLSDNGVRNIKEYTALAKNSLIGEEAWEHLPYIVIIVDEFANLMLRSPKDTEKHIARLASMARAVGMHLVVATQRPSVDVVTGVIKANFPCRIAFRVSSKIDSRTILDRNGAEALLGKGDMLYISPEYTEAERMQSPFVPGSDVEAIVAAVKKNGPPNYVIDFEELLAKQEQDDDSDGSMTDALSDPLFAEVLRYAVDSGEISASGIQRRFRVGYNRASRLIETLKDQRIISPPASAGKGWQVLITKDQIVNYID